MPVDNRNFIIEDLPDDPEDFIGPEEDDDDDDEIMTQNQQQQPPFTPRAPWQQQSFGTPPPAATVWPPSRPTTPWTPQFGTSYQPQQQTTGRVNQQYQQSQGTRIDRKKKIIFCDLFDILIESESAVREQQNGYLTGSNNYKRTGIAPRGLYDIRLKTEVWSKLAAFGADYIFCITNQPEKSREDMKTWKVMTDYVMYSLADYLNLPHSNCVCITKIGFSRDSTDTKPGTGLMKRALSTIKGYKYSRKDLIVVGINSGYQNQSNVDRMMAKRAGVDYLDVNDLLITYY
jgi:hypothetical protein